MFFVRNTFTCLHSIFNSWLGDAFLCFLVVLNFSLWWVGQHYQHPDDAISVLAMYREEPGYHPLFRSMGEPTLGETVIYEEYGQGIRFMPIPSLMPFGILIKLFGPYGYIVADAIIPVLFYLCMRKFATLLGGDLLVARIFAFFCTLRTYKFLEVLIGFKFPLIWGYKIPRPFVSELYFIGALIFILALILQPQRSQRQRWIWLAVLIGLVAQSQFYFLLPLVVAASVAAVFALLDCYKDGKQLRQLFVTWCWCIAIGLVVFLPFIVQRLNESDDIHQRMGLVAMNLSSMPSIFAFYGDNPENNALICFLLAAVALAIVAFYALIHPNPEVRKGHIRATQVLGWLLLVSLLSPWLVVYLLNQTLLLHHFEKSFIAISSYCLLGCGLMLMKLPQSETIRNGIRKIILTSTAMVSLLLFSSQIWYYFTASPPPHTGVFDSSFDKHGTAYRKEFSKLADFLETRADEGDKVLGSFDTQVNSWWSSFGGGFVYSPDPTNSLASNEKLEFRVLEVAKIMRMPEAEFRLWVRDPYNIVYFLLLHKYAASRHYTASDLSDYHEEDLAKAWNEDTRVNDANVFVMPRSEEERLTKAMLALPDVAPQHRLDLLVVASPVVGEPSSERFEMVYSSDIFRVYKLRP